MSSFVLSLKEDLDETQNLHPCPGTDSSVRLTRKREASLGSIRGVLSPDSCEVAPLRCPQASAAPSVPVDAPGSHAAWAPSVKGMQQARQHLPQGACHLMKAVLGFAGGADGKAGADAEGSGLHLRGRRMKLKQRAGRIPAMSGDVVSIRQ